MRQDRSHRREVIHGRIFLSPLFYVFSVMIERKCIILVSRRTNAHAVLIGKTATNIYGFGLVHDLVVLVAAGMTQGSTECVKATNSLERPIWQTHDRVAGSTAS